MAKILRMKNQKSEPSKKGSLKVHKKQLYKLPSVVNEGQEQITIHFISASSVDGGLSVRFFVNNGLKRKVKFNKVRLVLLDLDQRVLARQSFDGEIIGAVGGGSSKVCVARFLPNNVFVKDIPVECKVVFDMPAKQSVNVKFQFQALPESITEDQRQELERILAELPPMKRGEVSFSPLHAKVTTNNDLAATVIVRNSADRKIKLEQIPLIIFDTHKEELARGQFDLNGLTIESSKAILLPLSFGPVSQDKEIDLSNWSVKVIQD